MTECRKMRALITASLYDDLEAREQRALDEHLGVCAACRQEAGELGLVVAAIPSAAPKLGVDLLPAVRRRLEEMTNRLGWWQRRAPYVLAPARLAWAGLACVLAAGLLFYGYGMPGQTPSAEPGHTPMVASTPVVPAQPSPVQNALVRAAGLSEDRDYVGAYTILAQAVEAHPDDPSAGHAQMECGDIAFSQLRWYPEAFEAYEMLAALYPRTYTRSPGSVNRRELLTEARETDYASLHKLDYARRCAEPFQELEKVVARYPATYVASLAAEGMVKTLEEKTLDDDATLCQAPAMQRARDLCTHPIAIAQLTIELGNVYSRECDDDGKARDEYLKVLDGDNMVLARLAEDSLAGLGPDLAD